MEKIEAKNLAIIRGNSVKLKEGSIKYVPLQIESECKETNKDDVVVLRSNVYFNNGELSFTLKCKSHETSVMVILHTFEEREEIVCGYSSARKTFLIIQRDGQNWKELSTAGKLEDYELDTEVKFQIIVKGSQLNLFINNIPLCSASISIKNSPIEFIVQSTGEFEIYDISKCDSSSKPSAFVVMQFSKEYDDLFDGVIKPITEGFGYECIRATDIYTATPILNDIISSIKDSSVVVAEITPDNPNVFYEIGYSHAIGKPTILLCDRKRDKLPFDISGFRTLYYDNTIAGKTRVENDLKMYLNAIAGKTKVENDLNLKKYLNNTLH